MQRLVQGRAAVRTAVARAHYVTTADLPLLHLPPSTFTTDSDQPDPQRTETITTLSRLVRSVVENACHEGSTAEELSMPLLALGSIGLKNWGVRLGGDPGVFSSAERAIVSQIELLADQQPAMLGRLTLAERMVASADQLVVAGPHELALREVLDQADSTKAGTVAGWCHLLQSVASRKDEYSQLRPQVLQMLAHPVADEWGDSEKMVPLPTSQHMQFVYSILCVSVGARARTLRGSGGW